VLDGTTMRAVLAASRDEGLAFEDAWFRALRQLVPPPGCPDEVVAEHLADKALWREMKPHWRAAYERRRVEAQALADGLAHAHRRLADLLLADGELEREIEEELGRVEQAEGRQQAAAA
jgi:hypothetical protein